jgi:iron complex outermembrane receptor protein
VTDAQPDEKLTFAADIGTSGWGAQLNATYFGTYASQPLVGIQEFGSKTIVDLTGHVTIGVNVELSAGVQNIGDEMPDALIGQQLVVGSTGNSFPTGEESPIGVNGRSYFLRLRAAF